MKYVRISSTVIPFDNQLQEAEDKITLPPRSKKNIEEILDQLGHAKYFSTLDLASGFHQIGVKEEDKPKTGFSTPQGVQQNALWT